MLLLLLMLLLLMLLLHRLLLLRDMGWWRLPAELEQLVYALRSTMFRVYIHTMFLLQLMDLVALLAHDRKELVQPRVI